MNIQQLVDVVVSHCMELGHFERVNLHEPKNKAGHGLTAAVWVDYLGPSVSSGLPSTTAVFRLMVRLYMPMTTQPEDMIDPAMTQATSDLMASIHGGFTFGGLVRQVDLLGAYGVPLQAQAGYLEQDNVMMRVMTITVPLIVNDAWDQEA